jgi:hypothetical protein
MREKTGKKETSQTMNKKPQSFVPFDHFFFCGTRQHKLSGTAFPILFWLAEKNLKQQLKSFPAKETNLRQLDQKLTLRAARQSGKKLTWALFRNKEKKIFFFFFFGNSPSVNRSRPLLVLFCRWMRQHEESAEQNKNKTQTQNNFDFSFSHLLSQIF